jgi:hypothetical protein
MIQGTVITDFSRFSDNYAHAVVDKKTPANNRTGMYLDPCQPSRQMRKQSCQPLKTEIPQIMIKPMQDNGMHPGVTGQHFPGVSGCRVSLEHAIYIFTNADVFVLENNNIKNIFTTEARRTQSYLCFLLRKTNIFLINSCYCGLQTIPIIPDQIPFIQCHFNKDKDNEICHVNNRVENQFIDTKFLPVLCASVVNI